MNSEKNKFQKTNINQRINESTNHELTNKINLKIETVNIIKHEDVF